MAISMTNRLLVITYLLAAWGCGLKGDLYLPEENGQPAAPQVSTSSSEVDDDDNSDNAGDGDRKD